MAHVSLGMLRHVDFLACTDKVARAFCSGGPSSVTPRPPPGPSSHVSAPLVTPTPRVVISVPTPPTSITVPAPKFDPVPVAKRIISDAYARANENVRRFREMHPKVPLKRRRAEFVRATRRRRVFSRILELDLSDDASAAQLAQLVNVFSEDAVCDALLWAFDPSPVVPYPRYTPPLGAGARVRDASPNDDDWARVDHTAYVSDPVSADHLRSVRF